MKHNVLILLTLMRNNGKALSDFLFYRSMRLGEVLYRIDREFRYMTINLKYTWFLPADWAKIEISHQVKKDIEDLFRIYYLRLIEAV